MSSPITTHVLDVSRGRPAQGVPVTLSICDPDKTWRVLGRGTTDVDGRLRTLLPDGHALVHGTYRLVFDTAAYFATLAVDGFFPEVTIAFVVRETSQHHHVPLLLSPFGYSTYRGS